MFPPVRWGGLGRRLAVHSVTTARPLVARWDGQAWTRSPFRRWNTLLPYSGLDAIGDYDIWAVGYYSDQGEVGPITAHWDGTA